MKAKLGVLFLMLTMVCWGQTANPPATPDQSAPAAKGACCTKMASDAGASHKSCCHGTKAKGDATAVACCSSAGKSSCCDASQCIKAGATGASCCSGKNQCGAKGKGCCGGAMQTAKMECCGKQCAAHAPDPTELRN